MEFARKITKRKKMDMTPLIDIIFQLVIFFMLSSSFVEMQALDVSVSNNSSQANESATNSQNKQEVIKLGNGTLTLSDKNLTDKGLEYALKEVASKNPNQRVVIKVEEGVSVQRMVDIVDIAKTSGILNLDLK